MIGQGQFELLQRAVFADQRAPVFAVLDGAMIDALPERLPRLGAEAMCLFSGDLDPVLAAAAPYVVSLGPASPAAEFVLRDGWDDHRGIVLVADAGTTLRSMRAHLRRVLRVRAPGGQPMLFRFYDPRAFRAVVPGFDDEQHRQFFGPIQAAWIEHRTPGLALCFSRGDAAAPRSVPLSAAA